MQRILFDISHPCDLNFFKFLVRKISSDENIDIYFTVLRRNLLPNIVEEEFKGFNIKKISRHRGTILSIILEANIFKFFQLLFYIIHIKPVLCVSFGSFTLGAVCKLLRIKNIQFWDDPENKKNKFLQKLTADLLFYPFFMKPEGKIKTFNALKEWSYLSPNSL